MSMPMKLSVPMLMPMPVCVSTPGPAILCSIRVVLGDPRSAPAVSQESPEVHHWLGCLSRKLCLGQGLWTPGVSQELPRSTRGAPQEYPRSLPGPPQEYPRGTPRAPKFFGRGRRWCCHALKHPLGLKGVAAPHVIL
jgi:hypothetical protein